MAQQAGGGDATLGNGRRRCRATAIAVHRAALVAVAAFGGFCVDVGHTQVAASCQAELFLCLGDDVCTTCLKALHGVDLPLVGATYELCSGLYSSECTTMNSAAGCNIENAELLGLFTCFAGVQDGCGSDAFTTCATAVAAAGVATPAPSLPVFSTPVFPLPSAAPLPPGLATAAPSAGYRGGDFLSQGSAAPTASPSAAAFSENGAMDKVAPSEIMGTMAPSAIMETMALSAAAGGSVAPTGVDGLRGGAGIDSIFSTIHITAPTGLESRAVDGPVATITGAPTSLDGGGVGGIEDGANGGVASWHTTSTMVAWTSWLVGFVCAVAVPAI